MAQLGLSKKEKDDVDVLIANLKVAEKEAFDHFVNHFNRPDYELSSIGLSRGGARVYIYRVLTSEPNLWLSTPSRCNPAYR